MKRTINFSQFCDAFTKIDRQGDFSYAAKQALFDYLEEYEDSTGEEYELDVISLCCEYSEYNSASDCVIDCGYPAGTDDDDTLDDDEKEEIALEYLRDNTQVLEFKGGIIIAEF